jgi:hypothetical protein
MKVIALALLFVLPVSAQVVVQTLDAPDTNISGLAFGGGWMWAVDGMTDMLYKVNSSTGAVEASYDLNLGTLAPTGVGFGNNQVYVALNSGYVNYYSVTGAYLGQFSALC